MPNDFSNVNISLQKFQDISKGTYNAGDVRLSGKDDLVKVNDHVFLRGKNKVDISKEEVLAVKNAFINALKDNGITDEAKLTELRERLGLGSDNSEADPLKSAKPLTRAEIRNILDENAETINSQSKTRIVTSTELYRNVGEKEMARRTLKRESVNQKNEARVKGLYLATATDRAKRLVAGNFKGLNPEQRSDMRDFVLKLINNLNVPEENLQNKPHITFDENGNASIFLPDPNANRGYKTTSIPMNMTRDEVLPFLEKTHETLIGYTDGMSEDEANQVTQEVIQGLLKGDLTSAPLTFLSSVNTELGKSFNMGDFPKLSFTDVLTHADRSHLENCLKASVKNGKLDAVSFAAQLAAGNGDVNIARTMAFASEVKSLISQRPVEGLKASNLTPAGIRKILEMSPQLKQRLDNCNSPNAVYELVNGSGRIETWRQLNAISDQAVMMEQLESRLTVENIRNELIDNLTDELGLTPAELALFKKEFKMPAGLSEQAIQDKRKEFAEQIKDLKFNSVQDFRKAVNGFIFGPVDKLYDTLQSNSQNHPSIYYTLKSEARPPFYMQALLAGNDPDKLDRIVKKAQVVNRAAENDEVVHAFNELSNNYTLYATNQLPIEDFVESLRTLGQKIADSLKEQLELQGLEVDTESNEFRDLVGSTFAQRVGVAGGRMLFNLVEMQTQIQDVVTGQNDYANIMLNTALDYNDRFQARQVV